MAGFVTFLYFISVAIVSFNVGFNWLSGSLLLGSVCALMGGSGAKGMWHTGKKGVGSLMGIALVGGGYLAVKSSGVMLNLGSVVVSGEAWVIVGAVIFFLITNKQHSVT